MDNFQLITLASMRLAIGYLGEKEQFGWWQSSFCSPGATAFLIPVFGRTSSLAQISGVTRAAALVHDERVGVGQIYHLFRLPEELEQALHRLLLDANLRQTLSNSIVDTATALRLLENTHRNTRADGTGPTRIGTSRDLTDPHTWRKAAALYSQAFEQGTKIFPYFTDRPA